MIIRLGWFFRCTAQSYGTAMACSVTTKTRTSSRTVHKAPDLIRMMPNIADHNISNHISIHRSSSTVSSDWLLGKRFGWLWSFELTTDIVCRTDKLISYFPVTVRKPCPLWNSTQLRACKRRRETRAWRHASPWNHVVNRVQLMSTALSFWCYFLLKFWFCEWASWNIVTSTLIFWPQNIYVTSLSRYITQNFGFLIQYVSICFVFN